MRRRSVMRQLGGIGTCAVMLLVTVTPVSAQTLKEPAPDKIPKGYQDKHMPQGWWTDPKVIAEGKRLFGGMVNPEVVCAACHGRDGRPLLTGTRDLRDAAYVNQMTDSYMFWRVSEGVPQTPMTPWKEKLTEDQIWEVIAYAHTFSHGGKAEVHSH